MHIILCLDYSANTSRILVSLQNMLPLFKDPKVSVIHIVDQALFASGTGYELQLGADIEDEGKELKALCSQYLGENVNYVEEYGVPMQMIDEILAQSDYDLLAIGTHSRSLLSNRLLGGEAEHLLRNIKKPVLVIP